MSRLEPIGEDATTPDQREVWDSIVASRGGAARLVGEHGGLIGPFNSMVTSPGIGGRIAALGEAIRFSNSVDNRLLELAIMTVGAHWRSNFEFWAHRRLAAEAGVEQAVIDAITEGREPECSRDDEAAIHRFTADLLATGRVDDEVYERATAVVGTRGVVDLTSAIGYYCLISLTLNAHAVPLPPGEEPIWPE